MNAPSASPDRSFRFFCPCPRGLEQALADELLSLGADDTRTVPGGVECRGTLETAYRINLQARIPSRVLLRLLDRPCRDERTLYQLCRDTRWENWFSARQTIRVDVVAIRSPLRSLNFATLRIKDAIVDRFRDQDGSRPSVDTHHPDVRISAFLTAERLQLYLDLSGEPLFKRGWRNHQDRRVSAPLKENLAAGLLALSGWSRTVQAAWAADDLHTRPAGSNTPPADTATDNPATPPADAHATPPSASDGKPPQEPPAPAPLLDPFCGSGTIVIEAAQILCDCAPGLNRKFGIESLRIHDAPLFTRIRNELRRRADEGVARAPRSLIAASDLDPQAVALARENLQLAGLPADIIRFGKADAVDPRPHTDTAGFIVTNPPYNERVSMPVEQWRAIGATLRNHFGGWQAFLLTSDRGLPGQLGLRESRKTVLFNGAIECRLFQFSMRVRVPPETP